MSKISVGLFYILSLIFSKGFLIRDLSSLYSHLILSLSRSLLSLLSVSVSLSALSSHQLSDGKRSDFETTWEFSLAQFLLRQTDAHDPYLSNDIKISAVACVKAPLLGKRGNSTL